MNSLSCKMLLLVSLLYFSCYSFAKSDLPTKAELPSADKKFLISHVMREDAKPYVDFIEKLYQELGFNVELVPTPGSRGIILVNEGVVDADVVRPITDLVGKSENILIVQPAINTVFLALICIKNIRCDADVLNDSNVVVAGAKKDFASLASSQFKASLFELTLAKAIPDMLRSRRTSYGLLIIDQVIGKAMAAEFNLVYLKDLHIYHIISQKHAGLLPKIEAKLREKLPLFLQSRK